MDVITYSSNTAAFQSGRIKRLKAFRFRKMQTQRDHRYLSTRSAQLRKGENQRLLLVMIVGTANHTTCDLWKRKIIQIIQIHFDIHDNDIDFILPILQTNNWNPPNFKNLPKCKNANIKNNIKFWIHPYIYHWFFSQLTSPMGGFQQFCLILKIIAARKYFKQKQLDLNLVSTWYGWLSARQWYHQSINSLWLSDAIWHRRTWSTLGQVLACRLMTLSHYLDQCWLIIYLRVVPMDIIEISVTAMCFKVTQSKLQPHLPGGNEWALEISQSCNKPSLWSFSISDIQISYDKLIQCQPTTSHAVRVCSDYSFVHISINFLGDTNN